LNLREWDERYRSGEQAFDTPTPLVVKVAEMLQPGYALDLACGAGRNALYLAGRGWRVTAVDGSAAALELMRERAARLGVPVQASEADLDSQEFAISPEAYDLICDCYYLRRDLFPKMKAGVRPGGVVISIVHLADADQPRGTARRAYPAELPGFFEGWKVLDYREGAPSESCHQRAVAEIAAQKPRL
jgi:tellurite methyltransferase